MKVTELRKLIAEKGEQIIQHIEAGERLFDEYDHLERHLLTAEDDTTEQSEEVVEAFSASTTPQDSTSDSAFSIQDTNYQEPPYQGTTTNLTP